MFVTKNTISAIKNYFFNELTPVFHKTEVESFFYLLSEQFLGFSKSEILLSMNKSISESEMLLFHYAIKDLKLEKPVQYITGNQYFYENEFLVNEHTLIPRPETEELVDLIIKENKDFEGVILDIGTGTGVIAISLDLKLTNSKVTAFDVSNEALKQAEKNKIVLNSKVVFLYQDILNSDYKGDKFDIIVSNPPYVKMEEKELMNSNVLDYEPHLALFVENNNALIFYIKIIEFALEYLNPKGKLYFEINEQYGKEIAELLQNNFQDIGIVKDIYGKDRIVKATRI